MSTTVTIPMLKGIVKSLNPVLVDQNMPKIKIVGVKLEVVMESVADAIIGLHEAGLVELVPDDVIEFYNKHIAAEESEESGESKKEENKKESSSANPSKSTKRKKAPPKSTPKQRGKQPATKNSEEKKVQRKRSPKGSRKTDPKKTGHTNKRGGLVPRVVQIYTAGMARKTPDIVEMLRSEFPEKEERALRSSVASVVCVLKHVPEINK